MHQAELPAFGHTEDGHFFPARVQGGAPAEWQSQLARFHESHPANQLLRHLLPELKGVQAYPQSHHQNQSIRKVQTNQSRYLHSTLHFQLADIVVQIPLLPTPHLLIVTLMHRVVNEESQHGALELNHLQWHLRVRCVLEKIQNVAML